jgi:hypothetical protein
LVVDVCRDDVTRGQVRPGGGPMGPKLDAALARPPAGVQVWSACVAGQSSHEFDGTAVGDGYLSGGVFLSLLTQAFARRGAGIQKPDDPLPLDFLTRQVNAATERLVRERDKAEQTPRLAGRESADGAAYDPHQPMPARFELPPATALAGGELADRRLVEDIFAEASVPPVRHDGMDARPESARDAAARLAAIVPFRAAALKPYTSDYQSLNALLQKPNDYPLRVAVIRTYEALDRQGRQGTVRIGDKDVGVDRPISEFRGPADERRKKELTESQKLGPAKMLLELTELHDAMESAGAARGQEPSKRWQAHYDYALAQLKARMVYLNEYNTLLAKVKRDELPPLDPKQHDGYRVAAQEKVQSPKEVRDLAAESKKLLAKVVREHAGTPWEVLAKRDLLTALGLAWQPAKLGDVPRR